MSALTDNAEAIVRARRQEGDTADEVGVHLQGATLDKVMPAVAGDLEALDLLTDALALVDWADVAQKLIWKVEGTNPWKI